MLIYGDKSMALWKQPGQQPFTTYRDPQTGRWITIHSPNLLQKHGLKPPFIETPKRVNGLPLSLPQFFKIL